MREFITNYMEVIHLFKIKSKVPSIYVKKIENRLNVISLIDIREPDEYTGGHVPSAVNIPMQALLSDPNAYLEKGQEYHIICRSGVRSLAACRALLKQGYKVVNVSGGTIEYTDDLIK